MHLLDSASFRIRYEDLFTQKRVLGAMSKRELRRNGCVPALLAADAEDSGLEEMLLRRICSLKGRAGRVLVLVKSGCLYAIVADRKLLIAKELSELQQRYSEKYGKYEVDKSMTGEDWADMSSLNASIIEAETFELSIEGDNSPVKQLPVVHSSTTSIDERREMFERIEQLEKKLWLEQERFEYSMIPGEDVKKARSRFYASIDADCIGLAASRAPKGTRRKRGEPTRVTPLKEMTNAKVDRVKSATSKRATKRRSKSNATNSSVLHQEDSKRRLC
uniref:Sm domain-containing protein n=1 Tax=Ascaris lumbricoides TaxID=6252 RepID=A0A0M3IJN5_ASCLU